MEDHVLRSCWHLSDYRYRDGHQYVGKADGEERIRQRWSTYAANGHGCNALAYGTPFITPENKLSEKASGEDLRLSTDAFVTIVEGLRS